MLGDKMINTLKKGILLGIGIAALSKERAEKAANKLVKKGTITQRQAQQFVKTLMKIAEQQQKKAINLLDKDTRTSLRKIAKTSKKEAKALEKRLLARQKRLKEQAISAIKMAIEELGK